MQNSIRTLCLSLLLLSSPLFSQDNMLFEQINVEHGLSQNDVRCILQDSRGYVWIGTRSGGLNIYNGYSFIYLREGNGEKDISRNEIFGLIEDSHGDIWISVVDGLNRINVKDGTVDRFLHKVVSGKDYIQDFTSTLAIDSQGKIWINSSNGICYFDTATEKFSYLPRGVIKGSPYSIEITEGDELWIVSSANNLYKLDKNKGEFLHLESDILKESSKVSTISICKKDKSSLLIVSSTSGVTQYNIDTGVFTDFSGKLSKYILNNKLEIDSASFCSHGYLWIGSRWDGGLIRYDPQTDSLINLVKNLSSYSGLQSGHVDCITQDSCGGHWVGTRSGGITKISETKFSRITPGPETAFGKVSPSVRSILLDSRGQLWVRTDSDISIINRKDNSVKVIPTLKLKDREVKLNSVYVLREVSPEKILVGGIGLGLTLLDRDSNRGELIYESSQIRHLAEDKNGDFWISQGRGPIVKFSLDDSLKVRKMELPQSLLKELTPRYIRCIFIARDNSVWFGTNKGMLVFDQNTEDITFFVSNTEDGNSLHGDNIYTICEDDKGCIWAGSAGSGINILDRKSGEFSHITTEDGLPDDVIYQIVEDHSGIIWVATNNGLASINRKGEIRSFRVQDGLQSREFNVGASFISPEGEIFLGGINGLNYFQSGQVRISDFQPQVNISAISPPNSRIYSFSGSYDENITNFDYEERDLRFELSSSDYTVLGATRFSYKLVGYDQGWSLPATDNTIVYTNIPSGQHELLVKAANSDGIWNDQVTSVKFYIKPAFWQTWWFNAAVVALAALLIYVFILWRVHRIRSHRDQLRNEVEAQTKTLSRQKRDLEFMNKELEAFSYTVSHDLRAPIYRIGNYCDFLIEDHAKVLDENGNLFLGKIREDVVRANQLVENLLALARVEKQILNIEKFDLVKVSHSVMERLLNEHRGVEIKISFPEQIIVEADLVLMTIVMENLLNNAVKFTGNCSNPEITISADVSQGQQVICVRDNGAGFSQEKSDILFRPFERLHSVKEFAGTGIGLATVKRIIQRHGGWIKAEGEEGKGASFFFTLS